MIALRNAARICAAAAVLCAGPAAAGTAPMPSIAAFAELAPRAPQISPDGTRFAVIRGVNGRPSVAVYKVDAPSEPPQIVTSGDWIIDDVRWVKNDVLMMYSKKNMKLGVYDRYQQDMLRPIGDAAAVLLKENKFVELAPVYIVDVALDDPDTVYIRFQNSVYTMNIRTGGKPKPVYKKYLGPQREGTDKWFLDGHGEVLARVDTVRDQKSYDNPLWHNTLKVLDKDGSWRALGTYDQTVDTDDGVAGVSEDGKSIYRLAPDSKGTVSLNRIDIATGTETKLFQDPTYDVAAPLRNEWTGRVVGYVIDEDMPVFRYFDEQREALQKGLEQAFPGLSVHAVSTDVAGDKMIIETVGPRTPASYYLFDRNTHHATAIVASYPDLDTATLGEVRSYGYAARDGLHIPAYLTLPPGRDAHNLPFVVMPHGGPDARDDMTFDFFSQFLASRGYAVLRPQFRGSRGFGRPFTAAGLHQWGLKMQDDISDGVKKVIADGIADPKRVCIFGASYGGYAALAGATLTPDLYACVISFEGVSNLPDLMGYDKREYHVDITNGSFTATRMGDIFMDSAQLDAASPALHADRVTAPVLLLHSELDVTVPIAQSEMMEAALEKAGKNVQFVRIPGDDHYMSLESTRSRVLEEVGKFLAASIGT